ELSIPLLHREYWQTHQYGATSTYSGNDPEPPAVDPCSVFLTCFMPRNPPEWDDIFSTGDAAKCQHTWRTPVYRCVQNRGWAIYQNPHFQGRSDNRTRCGFGPEYPVWSDPMILLPLSAGDRSRETPGTPPIN